MMFLVEVAASLADRPVWVGTGACLRFVEAVVAAEVAKGSENSQDQLHVVPESLHSLSDPWRRAGGEFLLAFIRKDEA